MVGGGRILSCEDGIVEIVRGAGESAPVAFGPRRKPDKRYRFRGIETPAVRLRRSPFRVVAEPAAGSRIMGSGGPVRRFERRGDVGARAEAGIYERPLAE